MEVFLVTFNVILIVGGFSWLSLTLLEKYFQYHSALSEKRQQHIPKPHSESFVNNKLAALEKYMLLMERLSPENIVLRLDYHDLTIINFEKNILLTIHKEFEYNSVQQLYLSEELWRLLTLTKQELIKLVTSAASKLNPDAPAEELATALIEIGNQKQPCTTARSALRREASSL